MATKAGGYHLKDGTKVPSVTGVLGRYKECGGLLFWAWRQGKEGKDFREERDAAADAGTLAHEAVEWFIKGNEFKWPLEETDITKRARTAFGAFLEWTRQTQLKITHTELALVSEKHRFGGTLDAMLIQGERSLGDWKSSGGIYTEYLCQIAAYGILWDENYPDDPITGGFHLIRFDKEYGDFHHGWWSELETAKKTFLLLREAYEHDKELKQRIK